MKNVNRWLALGMATMMVAGTLAGCGSSNTTTTGTGSDNTAATEDTAAETTAAETTVAETTAASAEGGSVYYLNFKPEQDEQWQALAKSYSEQTGVEVTVVTAASGNYETTLMSEMGKSGAPTLFQVNGPVGLANWKDFCYDLSDSAIYGELTSEGYALKDGDAVAGIAYVIESYGLICNKTLLAEAGYSVDDIKSFDDLKKATAFTALLML